MKKTAIFALAAILLFAPFQAIHAAPPTDFEQEIVILKTQIQLLELRLAKLEANQKVVKEKTPKVKKITNKKNKRMAEPEVVAGSSLPQAVLDLDAKWAEREAELDAKYKIPGKWKQVDDKAVKEFKRYQDKRERLFD